MVTRKSLIIEGRIRDKQALINIAASQAKKTFHVAGNVTVIDIDDFNPDVNGQVVIVEFEADVKSPAVVGGKREHENK